jgi:hypothetical protein
VAADSREINTSEPPDDTTCKISALNGQIIFFATNFISYQSKPVGLVGGLDPAPSWRASDDAKQAYINVVRKGQQKAWVGAIADEWGKTISRNITSLYAFHPELIVSLVKGGILTTAFIGGVDVPGYLVAFQVQITFDKSKGTPVEYTVFPISCASRIGPYCAFRVLDIAFEYINLFSPRAVGEFTSWMTPMAFSRTYNPSDLDILKTIRLVDLTIAYHKGNEVGGKIDAAQITKAGTIRWFARKENCPGN